MVGRLNSLEAVRWSSEPLDGKVCIAYNLKLWRADTTRTCDPCLRGQYLSTELRARWGPMIALRPPTWAVGLLLSRNCLSFMQRQGWFMSEIHRRAFISNKDRQQLAVVAVASFLVPVLLVAIVN